jgi:peptidoglycan/xylan/chitin deacetylase (PgdA/CDA1 family)
MAHGVMFHHFHSGHHATKPGSIDADVFRRMLEHLRAHFRLLDGEVFLEHALDGSLSPDDVVLTFDDGLKSQIDVALPILNELPVSGIFNVYSSVFSGEPDRLEIYADFRATSFEDFPSFWAEFLMVSHELFPDLTTRLADEYPDGYLTDFPFYSETERRFRFLRDALLRPASYRLVMDEMLARSAYDVKSRIGSLWMDKADLVRLADAGHLVGLHSHTHPTRMSELSKEDQELEYRLNFNWIKDELGLSPLVVAHPCGDYSEDTLGVLDELGIRVGFRSSMTEGPFGSLLEIPRKDHAVLVKELG